VNPDASLLVVIDDTKKRNLLSGRLASEGYAVAAVASGRDAVSLVGTKPFDLVLLDADMPGMSGFEVLAQIRREYPATHLPVIMVTPRSEGPEVVEAFSLGANDCITSTTDAAVALARIAAHVAHRRAVQDLRDTARRSAVAAAAPPRQRLLDLIDHALKRTTRRPDYAFAVFVMELDRFRMVSASLGSGMAERLLDAVAERLEASVGGAGSVATDQAGVAMVRLNGNEFAIVLEDIAGSRAAVRAAMRIRRAMEQPFDVDGHQLFTSAKIGIAVSTTGYRGGDEILRDATTALHRAQTDSTLVCELFDPAMREQAVARLHLETDLRRGVEENAFVVHYQPILALDTGRIISFEALVRWNHPRRGLLHPIEFIDVAEDTGMIVAIGRQVLTEACRQMADWQREFGSRAPRTICVNVSARQFADVDLADEVESILDESGLQPSQLKLEITESAFIDDVDAAQVTLKRLQGIGVKWSLDDFGTGYSSLNHLHRLNVNTVKIDRSFVSRVGLDEGGVEMVQAIVSLAHNLRMDVVAEGVESADQFARLRSLGCEYTQGFHFSRAVDAPAAERLISSQPWFAGDTLEEAC
jgi:diguanylate cyclase (GGDEF)-like protein